MYEKIMAEAPGNVGIVGVIKNNLSMMSLVWFGIGLVVTFIFISVVVLSLRSIIGEDVNKFFDWGKRYIVYVVITPIMIIPAILFLADKSGDVEVLKWENEFVVPYLEGLEEKKSKVVLEATNKKKKMFEESEYVRQAFVVYLDGDTIKEGFAEVKIDQEIKEPYVVYRKNDRDFRVNSSKRYVNGKGQYIEGGNYLLKLYIPLGYELEDKEGKMSGILDDGDGGGLLDVLKGKEKKSKKDD